MNLTIDSSTCDRQLNDGTTIRNCQHIKVIREGKRQIQPIRFF